MTYTTPTADKAAALVREMADYLQAGKPGPLLSSAEEVAGRIALRLICIGLLSWLKSSSRVPQMTSMKLTDVGSAAGALSELIGGDSVFSAVFAKDAERVCLLNEADQSRLAAMADDMYQPPRFVTRRKTPG